MPEVNGKMEKESNHISRCYRGFIKERNKQHVSI